MSSSRKPDPATLLRQLAEALGQAAPEPANEDEPAIDEDALRELAKRDAEEMKRARRNR